MANGGEDIVLKVLDSGKQWEVSQAMLVIKVWVLRQDDSTSQTSKNKDQLAKALLAQLGHSDMVVNVVCPQVHLGGLREMVDMACSIHSPFSRRESSQALHE